MEKRANTTRGEQEGLLQICQGKKEILAGVKIALQLPESRKLNAVAVLSHMGYFLRLHESLSQCNLETWALQVTPSLLV